MQENPSTHDFRPRTPFATPRWTGAHALRFHVPIHLDLQAVTCGALLREWSERPEEMQLTAARSRAAGTQRLLQSRDKRAGLRCSVSPCTPSCSATPSGALTKSEILSSEEGDVLEARPVQCSLLTPKSDVLSMLELVWPGSCCQSRHGRVLQTPPADRPRSPPLLERTVTLPQVEGVARLRGFAEISGGKNAVLPLLAASLLCRSPVTLRGVPDIADVRAMLDVLLSVGAAVHWPDPADPSVVVVDASGPLSPSPDAAAVRSPPPVTSFSPSFTHLLLTRLTAPRRLKTRAPPPPPQVRRTRAGFLVLGPLVARLGEAHVSLPGGCAIGARPVDLHVAVLTALGATTAETEDGVASAAPPAGAWGGRGSGAGRRLRGGEIELRFPSVGATETALARDAMRSRSSFYVHARAAADSIETRRSGNHRSLRSSLQLQMAAATAEGTTVIRNAAREPEVVELARFLCARGARIAGAGTPVVTVEGVRGLDDSVSADGTDYSVAPDRVEAATFLFAAAATRSDLSLGPVVPAHLGGVLQALRLAGCEVEEADAHAERRRLGLEASVLSAALPSKGRAARRASSHGEIALRIRPVRHLLAVGVSATPFPGFPTDCQPAWCAVIASAAAHDAAGGHIGGAPGLLGAGRALRFPVAPGVQVTDAVFEGRLSHLRQLEAFGLGARALDERSAELWPAAACAPRGRLRRARRPQNAHQSLRLLSENAPTPLSSACLSPCCLCRAAEVEATDLRCAAALLVAALAAEGTSRIRGAWHLDRGYERIERKLAAIGARVRRVAGAAGAGSCPSGG